VITPDLRRRLAGVLALGLFFQSSGLLACVNTRYSRDEERQITGETVKLIMGQFAHHGAAFYEDQLLTTTAELEEDAGNVEARNDRAVAWLKLGQYEKAEREFQSIESSHPGRYRTHANLGVLYKKMRRYREAAGHVRHSLEIRPEGHLGLGDYYLRMIDWLGDRKAMATEAPLTNFLGTAYADGPLATGTNALARRDYLVTLIKADRSFGDALLVLGDVLQAEGETELAYRAYHRARMLKHPADEELVRRMSDIYRKWRQEARSRDGYIVLPSYRLEEQLNDEAGQAAEWVRVYERAEADLVASGRYVDIASVKRAMAQYNVAEPKYVFTGVVKGSVSRPDRVKMYVALTVFFSICALLVAGLVRGFRAALRSLRNRAAVG